MDYYGRIVVEQRDFLHEALSIVGTSFMPLKRETHLKEKTHTIYI